MNLHPLQQAHASFALHKELISFVEEGLFDHMRRKKTASLALLKGALSEKVADSLSMFLPTKAMSFSQDMLGQGMELTYRKYLVWLSETFVLPDTPARGKYALLPHHTPCPRQNSWCRKFSVRSRVSLSSMKIRSNGLIW